MWYEGEWDRLGLNETKQRLRMIGKLNKIDPVFMKNYEHLTAEE